MTLPRLLLTLWHRLIRSEPEPPLRLNCLASSEIRTVTHRTAAGGLFRFNYNPANLAELDQRLNRLVRDHCIPFDRHDAAKVRGKILARDVADLAQFQLENTELQ